MNAHAHARPYARTNARTDARALLTAWRSDPHQSPAAGYVPAIVAAALERCQVDYTRAAGMPQRTDTDQAQRAARLAVVCARRARWWAVLAGWVYRPEHLDIAGPLPLVLGDAADIAAQRERDNARFWRETADDWAARAEHRPTSDAAGALSNLHELEVVS